MADRQTENPLLLPVRATVEGNHIHIDPEDATVPSVSIPFVEGAGGFGG